jgi:hypothetical protein
MWGLMNFPCLITPIPCPGGRNCKTVLYIIQYCILKITEIRETDFFFSYFHSFFSSIFTWVILTANFEQPSLLHERFSVEVKWLYLSLYATSLHSTDVSFYRSKLKNSATHVLPQSRLLISSAWLSRPMPMVLFNVCRGFIFAAATSHLLRLVVANAERLKGSCGMHLIRYCMHLCHKRMNAKASGNPRKLNHTWKIGTQPKSLQT